jgi:hypothetical protein
MVTRLFQKVKEVLARNVFEKQKEIRRRFEGAIEGDDVRVGGQRLVNRCLGVEVRMKQRGRQRQGRYTSNICALSASLSRSTLDRHLRAYSRPYLTWVGEKGMSSKLTALIGESSSVWGG